MDAARVAQKRWLIVRHDQVGGLIRLEFLPALLIPSRLPRAMATVHRFCRRSHFRQPVPQKLEFPSAVPRDTASLYQQFRRFGWRNWPLTCLLFTVAAVV